ncbi:MAG: hypothetical protein GX434_05440 [Peptococcaceae bacterium]|nr:hypothetical protein [Peptococcaceae bacterium]
MKKLWVKAGARLHLGQLDLNGSLGRIYGGFGLAIDQPQLEITAERGDTLSIKCLDKEEKRIERISRQYLKYYSLPGVKINVIKALPSHSGLGSGTQLSLALGFVISRVYGLQPSLDELAGITDRESSRSGIGVAAFKRGGFLVDGGKPVNQGETENIFKIPPILARIPFPKEWAIIVALPQSEEKIFGSKEDDAFQSLKPMKEEVSASICRLLHMKLLPSLKEKDLKGFGQAVTAIQQYVGQYFEPVQGGQYSSVQSSKIAEFLLSQGAEGVGQSSWGPALYAFTKQERKIDLLEKTRKFLDDEILVWGASGRNHGASWGWK